MEKPKKIIPDFGFMIIVLVCMYLINSLLIELFETHTVVVAIFILGALIISLKTEGYLWGILASICSVLIVNYTFVYPFYAFDFTIQENLATAIIMMVVSLITSTISTRLKKSEREKLESEQERIRANLLRAISHDLRTPLTSIYGSTSTVIQHYDKLDKMQKMELLNDVRSDAEWLIQMVENLLSITRVGDKTFEINKTSTVLEELLESVLNKFYKRHPEQKVTVNMPDAFILIPMEAMLIEQVFMNLLENAVLHAKNMTTLWLNVRTSENLAIIEVADDGDGMNPEDIEKLFTGSVKVDTTVTDGKRKNMGIGLPVCQTIVKAHGGTITARQREGGGMSFCFTLEMEDIEDE